jgi:uncharacterized protein (DUF952 family)
LTESRTLAETTRHHYTINLNDWVDAEDDTIQMRPPTHEDSEVLAELMLDAYRDTIDYDDETIVEAREEVQGFFADDPDLINSRVAIADGRIVCACLVTAWTGHPFIGYVMTGADHKGRGFGTATLRASLRSCETAGHRDVGAFITEGNRLSEAMFYRVGAVRRPTHVFHIAENDAWASRSDTYTPISFDNEGFIHCSTGVQLDRVAAEFYAGRDDLTLLTITAAGVGSILVYEDLYEANEPYPHVYGPIPLDAVAEAVRYSVR